MFRNDFAQSPAPQVQVRTPALFNLNSSIYVCMCIYIYTNVKTWPTFVQARDDQVRHHKHRSRGLHKHSHGETNDNNSKWLILTDKLWTRKNPPIHRRLVRGFHHGFYGPVLLRRLSSPLSQPSEWRSLFDLKLAVAKGRVLVAWFFSTSIAVMWTPPWII